MQGEKLGFRLQLTLSFSQPVTRHAFALRCLPESGPGQRVLNASLTLQPACEPMVTRDLHGLRHAGTVYEPHTLFQALASGAVETEPGAPGEAPPAWQLGPYRKPTPLTAWGPGLLALSEGPGGGDPVDAAMALLADRFIYLPGSTHAATTAEEAAAAMRGVCQDEAHIMLALLRHRGIPCRYVMGYMLGEGATHAWVEVLRDGKWLALDPTNRRAVNGEYIRVAVGRDADDCPLNRGVFSGSALQQSQSRVSVWRMNEA